MAGDVLRGRVHDDVGTMLERTLQQRRGERVVDRDDRAVLVCGANDRRDVGDLERGVGRRLEPHHRGIRARFGDRRRVGDVDEHRLRAAVLLALGQRGDGAGVRVPRRDDRAARLHEVEHRGDGGHAGCERHAVAALERAEGLLERGPRWVPVAAVLDVAAGHVGRGQVNRHAHGLVGLVRGPPRDDRHRLGMQRHLVVRVVHVPDLRAHGASGCHGLRLRAPASVSRGRGVFRHASGTICESYIHI